MESGSIEHQHPPPDLWQILHGPQTQDGPELQYENFYNKGDTTHKATTLDFGINDWNGVIQRGYSLFDFESFVNRRECVYVGPFWISKVGIQVNHTDTFIKLGRLYLARNPQQTDHSDDDIKSLVLPFLKLLSLHPGIKRCSIYAEFKWWLSVIHNECDIIFVRLDIVRHDQIDATTLHLAAAMTKCLRLHDCSIVSTTNTPYPTSINHSTNSRLQELQISNMKETDVHLLKSCIQKCTALEKLSIGYNLFKSNARLHFTSDQWMPLMKVCSQCHMLELIDLKYINVETDGWLPGLELLMRNQSLSIIAYYLDSYESPTQQQAIPHASTVSRANAIVQALMCNKTIITLCMDEWEIDDATFKSKILPILDCNILWKNVPPFCRDMDDTRGSTQLLGHLLSHRLLHQNPSFLFELVCKVNHQLSHMWHDGRHRRPDKPKLG